MMDYDKLAREIHSAITPHQGWPCSGCDWIAQALERAGLERAIKELETPRPYRYSFDSQLSALRKRLEELGK